MRRRHPGRYEVTTVGGEKARAFVPAPLPPKPMIRLDGALHQALESAHLALGRLDALASHVPDPSLFLYSYVRKEAVLSSQIEGTQSSLSDLMLFEIDEAPGVPLDDVTEVSNYVAALNHGLKRVRGGFPIANRLIREIHRVLLSRGRGSGKAPGEFRRSQNWIGGTRARNAAYVPPPWHLVEECMSALEKFINDEDSDLPQLVRAALVHVQFETIHPFLDGNGRVGRLLITLMLSVSGVLRDPLLYLSFYFRRHRSLYYEHLNEVRRMGDWERWLAFFLEGVSETAENASSTARRLADLFEKDRTRIAGEGRRAASALRVHEAMKKRPIASLRTLTKATGLTFPTAASAIELLMKRALVQEVTGRRRNRVFSYRRYLAILNDE